MRRWCMVAGVVLCCPVAALVAQETQPGAGAVTEVKPAPADVDAAQSATEVIKPNIYRAPTTDREIEERITSIQQRIAALEKEIAGTQPSTAPATAPAREVEIEGVPVGSRDEILRIYLNELQAWRDTRAQIKALGEKSSIENLSNRIAQLKQLAEDYRARDIPQYQFQINTARDVSARELSEYRSQLENLRNAHAQNEAQYESLPERRTRLEQKASESLEQLNLFLQALPGDLNEAASEAERRTLLIKKEILEWFHSLHLLRVATHADRRTLLELQMQQDADRITALNALVGAIQSYRTRLESHQAAEAIERAKAALQKEDLKPYLRVYWQLFLDANEGIAGAQKLSEEMLSRYPQSELEQLRLRVANSSEYRRRFLESLDRREGSEILRNYEGATERIEDSRLLLGELQRKLDQSYDEQREAIGLGERTEYAIRNGKAELDERIAELTGEDLIDARKKQMDLTTGALNTVREELSDLKTNQDQLIARLNEGTTLVEKRLEGLEDFRNHLHWRYLAVAEANLFQRDYGLILEEINQIRTGEGAAYDSWAGTWAQIRQDLAGVPASTYINLGLLALLAFWLGLRTRRRMRGSRVQFLERRQTESVVSEELQELAKVDKDGSEDDAPTPRERAHFLLLRVFGESAPWILPLGLLLIAVSLFHVGGSTYPLIAIVLAACFAGVLTLIVNDALFDPSRPLWRMVSCRTDTARYHRRRLRALTITLWITLPIVLLLRWVDLVPQLRETFWIYAKLCILVMALIYSARRRYFQPKSPQLRQGELFFLQKLSPLLPLVLAAATLLHVMGYHPFTDYVLRGVILTVLILSAAGFLRLLLSQWIHQQITKPAGGSKGGGAEEESSPGSVQAILLTLLQLSRFLLFFGVVFLLLPIWGVGFAEIMAVLKYPFFRGENPLTPLHVLGAFLAIAVGVFASRTLRAFLYSQVFPKADNLDRGVQTAIATLSHYAVIAISLYAAMKVIQLDFSALAVLFGTIGLGLGLGLQPLFVNFVSGLMILLERQVKVGDTIDVNGQLGEVRGISMRSTHVRSFDGIDFVIPNSEFISAQVTNWTMQDTVVRARVTVGAAYSSDPHLVKKILLGLAHTHPDVLVDPPPTVWFLDFADSALIFDLVCWFASPAARWGFMTTVRYDIMKEFKKHDIEIPFPQRTLSVLGGKPMPLEVFERPVGLGEVPAPGQAEGPARGQGDGENVEQPSEESARS